MKDEELDFKVVTLPTCCLERKLKDFTFCKNGPYLYDDKYNNVYEIVQYSEDKRSWFIGEMVIQDGSLLMVTRVDPLFIILPNLIASNKLFKSLQDIIGEDKGALIMIKIFETNKKALSTIADIKELDDECYYRLDEKKLIIWLKAKVNQIIKCLQHLKINVSNKSTKVTNFTSGRSISADEKDFVIYALNLLSKYLPDDLLRTLRENYNLKEEEIKSEPEFKPSANSTPKGQKRSMDGPKNCEPIDNYCIGEVQTNNAAKKAKLSRSQKELEKASKQSGVRSISAFFSKKPAKTN